MADNLYFPAYYRDWNAIRVAVTAQQGWKLFLAILDYAEQGTPLREQDEVMKAFFTLLAGGIDRSKVRTAEKSQKRRYARYCGICKDARKDPLDFDTWRANVDECQQEPTDVDTRDNPIESESKSKSKSKSKRTSSFVPPTVDEVRDYCREQSNAVHAEEFVDFYASNGWRVGKNQMRDWKAAVRNWERRNKDSSNIHDPDRYTFSKGESL